MWEIWYDYSMTVNKLTGKQEEFAQAIIDGASPERAYTDHYDTTGMGRIGIATEVRRILGNPKVAAQIALAMVPEPGPWTQERFINEAETNMALARSTGQLAPANGALTLIGKVTGIITEDRPSPDTALDAILKVAQALSDAQLRGLAAGRADTAIEGVFEVIPDGTS